MLLEDYGLIGPRFDSASCFSALLGDERHGRWLVPPVGEADNFPQAFSHLTLILAARAITTAEAG